ncbi:MAG: hypothetical protein ACR2PK_16120 [Acidimicrobiales bacterium]
MNENEFKTLFEDAVADVAAAPDAAGMSSRLQRVDKLRRVKTFVMATVVMVAATAGVAAAWPSDQEPIQLRLVDGGTDAEHVPRPDLEPSELREEKAQAGKDELALLVEPTPVAEQRALVDLSAFAQTRPLPTPVPKLEPVAPTHEPAHVEPVEQAEPKKQAKKQGEKGNKKAKNGGGGSVEERHEPSGESGATSQLTATAAYGSCEEPTPYDIYSGSAAPGGQVTISSPYSAKASVTADGGGHWSKQVTFEAAPIGEHFTVTISSGTQTVSLGFVRTG